MALQQPPELIALPHEVSAGEKFFLQTLRSIVEFRQAELRKTETDIADTDAKYQYRLTEIVLTYTI